MMLEVNPNVKISNINDNIIKTLRSFLEDNYLKIITDSLVIYGTGDFGKAVFSLIKTINPNACIECFCYSDGYHSESYHTEEYYNMSVMPVSEAKNLYPNSYYIIASSYYEDIKNFCNEKAYKLKLFGNSGFHYWQEIYINALSYEINHIFPFVEFSDYYLDLGTSIFERISLLKGYLDEESLDVILNKINFFVTGNFEYFKNIKISDNQYFSANVWTLSNNEVLFDCGAYIGDTVSNFLSSTKSKYKKILSFEPCYSSFIKLQNFIITNNLDNIEIYNVGISDDDSFIAFEENLTNEAGSKFLVNDENVLASKNVERVKTISLDNFIYEQPTIIKMDIEGFELSALKGAQNILKQLRPKLAICIYHKPEDVFEIIEFIKNIVPEYRFKVMHHSDTLYETVLYAYIDN